MASVRKEDIPDIHEKISDIQNSVWKAYKDFRASGDMRQYNNDIHNIVIKYEDDKLILNFARNIIISWAPIINSLAEEKRNEERRKAG